SHHHEKPASARCRARDQSRPHQDPTSERYRRPRARDPNEPRSAFAPVIPTAAFRTQSCSARVAAPATGPTRCPCPREQPFHTTTTSNPRRPCPEFPQPHHSASPRDTLPTKASRETDRQPVRSAVSQELLRQTPRTPSSRREFHRARFSRRHKALDCRCPSL